MCGQDKKNEEDALVAILKSLVGECKAVYANKGAQIEKSLDGTNEVQGVSFVVDDDIQNVEGVISRALPCQLPPKELNPLSFTHPCTIGEPSETMILGRPFLATIHALIDVFNKEISLGIREDRVLFDMDRGVYHSKIPVEKVYMTNSLQEEEYLYPLKIEYDVFSYESPACLLFEKCTRSCDNESIDTLDSVDNMQELKVFYDNKCGKDYGMWPTCNPDLSFYSGYDVIYGKGENGMLEQWMCFRDHE
ncbi:hypothetical protein Tco_1430052 [Tanacetum coccineum]